MIGRWRVPLRLAGRDVRRSRGRSALVVALLLLPVLALGAGDVLWRTMQLSPAEHAQRTFAGTAAIVSFAGGSVVQTPSGDGYSTRQSDLTPDLPALQAGLPAGSRLVRARRAGLVVGGPFFFFFV